MLGSADLTYAAICWLKYTRQCDLVCTEVGYSYLRDAFGIQISTEGLPKLSIEVEVKISLSDTHADFRNKARKHQWYSEGRHAPNYMYFLFPKSIAEEGAKIVNAQNPKYGVLSYDPEHNVDAHPVWIGKVVSSVSKCRKLTENPPPRALLYQMGRRLQNEYFMQRYYIQEIGRRITYDIQSHSRELAERPWTEAP